MTDHEKLAWAQKHGITPPKEFASKVAAETRYGCCSRGSCDTHDAEPAGESADWYVVQIDAVRKCQGLGSLWMILGQALPPAESETFETDLSLVSWLAPLSAAQVLSPAFDPATPPPRAAV